MSVGIGGKKAGVQRSVQAEAVKVNSRAAAQLPLSLILSGGGGRGSGE